MTLIEIRAMLARVNPRLLREEAGIRQVTVAVALGVPRRYIGDWERRKYQPCCGAGFAWARFIRGLEAHSMVTVPGEGESAP